MPYGPALHWSPSCELKAIPRMRCMPLIDAYYALCRIVVTSQILCIDELNMQCAFHEPHSIYADEGRSSSTGQCLFRISFAV
jgi:hypothetical protein